MKYLLLCTVVGLGMLTGCGNETDAPETLPVDPASDVEPTTPDATVTDPAIPGTTSTDPIAIPDETRETPPFPTEGTPRPGAIETPPQVTPGATTPDPETPDAGTVNDPDVQEEPAQSLPES